MKSNHNKITEVRDFVPYLYILLEMPKDFQYNVIQLINSVKDRPCLWDKSLESYKDRIERRTAWEEVFNSLDSQYEEKSSKEKKITEEQITTKWTNIRDAFMKTLKNKYGKPKRKYIYHNELRFLVKCELEHTQNSDEGSYSSTECTDNSTIFNTSLIKCEKDSGKESSPVTYKTGKRSKKRESCDKNGDFNFVEVEEGDPRVMNEDEAFFASLLPSVVKYTEDERLEFRIEVLALMRRIKDNRNWSE